MGLLKDRWTPSITQVAADSNTMPGSWRNQRCRVVTFPWGLAQVAARATVLCSAGQGARDAPTRPAETQMRSHPRSTGAGIVPTVSVGGRADATTVRVASGQQPG